MNMHDQDTKQGAGGNVVILYGWTQWNALPVYQFKRLLIIQPHELVKAQLFNAHLRNCHRASSSIHTHLFVVWKLLLPHPRRRFDTVQLIFHADARTSGNGIRAVLMHVERWYGVDVELLRSTHLRVGDR